MPVNLPPTLGSSGARPLGSNLPKLGKIGVPTNVGRAQSTAVTSLQQRVGRQNARVSMNQVMAAKAEAQGQKSTSINRIMSGGNRPVSSIHQAQNNAKTSINAPDRATDNSDMAGDDDQRYTYMRRLIKARQAKEHALQQKKAEAEANKSPLNVATGTSMHHGGAGGFHKQVGKFFRSNRTQFSHLSKDQKAVLESTIENKLEHKTTGSKITRYDRMAMKKDISKAKSQGQISYRTAQQFKKIVGKLGT